MRGARRRRRPPTTPRSRSCEQYARTEPAVRGRRQHLRPGPGQRHPLRHRSRAAAAVVVVTMADGCDDPRQIDDLARLVERGVVVAAASRYMPGGQQVGGPVLKRLLSRSCRAGRLHSLAPGRHPRRDQLVQGLLDGLRARRSGSTSRAGFEIGHRARPPRPGGCGCRSPRSRRSGWTGRPGVSNFKLATWIPGVPALVPLRVRAAAARSTRSGASGSRQPERESDD